MDVGGTSDPYVKIRLLPKKKPVFSTQIVKKNCNPLFNETFLFEVGRFFTSSLRRRRQVATVIDANHGEMLWILCESQDTSFATISESPNQGRV